MEGTEERSASADVCVIGRMTQVKKRKTIMLSQDVIAGIEAQVERERSSFSEVVNKILRDHLEAVLEKKSDPEEAKK